MKKLYTILAVAALVGAASCTKVETDEIYTDSDRISFEVADYMVQTKANTSLNAEGITTFKTHAYFFPAVGDAQYYMNDVSVNFTDGSPKVWAPARDYYWPKTGYINFYSYAGTKDATITFDDATHKTATASYTNQEIAADDNILLADPALKQTKNLTEYTSVSGVTSGVPTLFRHLLAKINFTIKLATTDDKKSATTKFVVTVLNADTNLSNLVVEKKGSYTASLAAGDASGVTAWSTFPNVWTLSSPSVQETVDMLTPELTLPVNTKEIAAVSLLDERTVMPQTLTNVENFKLSYKVETYYGSEASPYMTEIFKIDAPIKDLVAGIAAWNKNTKITYNIIIDPVSEKITFDPAVEEWATENGSYNYPVVTP